MQARLNATQLIGLKYVREFESKIPRAEMKQLEAAIIAAVNAGVVDLDLFTQCYKKLEYVLG